MRTISLVLLWLLAFPVVSQEHIRLVTFNVENLFDCKDDSLTNDETFLPTSLRHWTEYRYWNKLHAISRALTAIGGDRAPELVALCEVENDSVLYDLTRRSSLRTIRYDYLVTSSTDPRGIDVALLYKPTTYRPFAHKVLRLPSDQIHEGTHVRDVLCVSGELVTGDTLDVLVCHLPSRLNGRKSTRLRQRVVSLMCDAIDSLSSLRAMPHIVVMGDFNDIPSKPALRSLSDNNRMKCITEQLGGSYRYKGKWEQIDHVYLSPMLLDDTHLLHLAPRGAWVFNDDFLTEPEPLYGGRRPFRTYNGMRYMGGTSDHLPVCFDLLFSW
ncbi:MAG: endonuclease [Bacteroidaceae bacterium]|nr:endonuclease [Bacteroidaceae bacterium]